MDAPNVLIVYGTTHGQTAKIAASLQNTLTLRGLRVTITDVKDPTPPLDLFQGVMIGASVIARGHQPSIAEFIRDHVGTLNTMPSAFFSVSASAGSSLEKGRAAAGRLRDEFLVQTGFRPGLSEAIAGAINYTQYNFLLRWYMKKAARMNGGSTDTSRDHEYTDWAQVRAFADNFADLVIRNADARAAVSAV